MPPPLPFKAFLFMKFVPAVSCIMTDIFFRVYILYSIKVSLFLSSIFLSLLTPVALWVYVYILFLNLFIESHLTVNSLYLHIICFCRYINLHWNVLASIITLIELPWCYTARIA